VGEVPSPVSRTLTLEPADVVEVEVERLGVLRMPIRAASQR
jgi:2-keto-4-pentenoate hydratase/2-oxohepta-3-ene-1,7-dioic acid hydratase in catechol pathway